MTRSPQIPKRALVGGGQQARRDGELPELSQFPLVFRVSDVGPARWIGLARGLASESLRGRKPRPASRRFEDLPGYGDLGGAALHRRRRRGARRDDLEHWAAHANAINRSGRLSERRFASGAIGAVPESASLRDPRGWRGAGGERCGCGWKCVLMTCRSRSRAWCGAPGHERTSRQGACVRRSTGKVAAPTRSRPRRPGRARVRSWPERSGF